MALTGSPAVSVVLPVYNAERFLVAAIESMLRQTLGDFELIVVDDASTDRSAEIVGGFRDPRIRYLRNEANQGVAATLNRGLALAKGELIARMDADDVSLPGRLEKQADRFAADPGLVLCCTNVVSIDANGRRITGPWFAGSGELGWDLCFQSPIPHPSVMLRASALRGISYPLQPAEDLALWRKLYAPGRFARLTEVLLEYRSYAASSYQANEARHEAAALATAREYLRTFVPEADAEVLLALTRHAWRLRKGGPRIEDLAKAGTGLVLAYAQRHPQSSRDQLFRELHVRMLRYLLLQPSRGAAIAGWIRSPGLPSLIEASGLLAWRFARERLQHLGARMT